MPIVAHNGLPTFERLRADGQFILDPNRALHQDIRELHIGLLNMMPDAALEFTERQFCRLVGQSNQIAQFFVHPFSLEAQPRGPMIRDHIERYYETFDQIRAQGLDALIITGAVPKHPDLASEAFWEPLSEVIDWAVENVTSTLCSCLATHAVLQLRYGQRRVPLAQKRWGVYAHQVVDDHRHHPLVRNVNTRFDVPHSRFNEISRHQFDAAGLRVLVESDEAGVHLAVSEDGLRLVFFQGHPEYDTDSLFKEYNREVRNYVPGERPDYPPLPENYFSPRDQALLDDHRTGILTALNLGETTPELPAEHIAKTPHNTWHDTAEGVMGNWIGCVYQITNTDRHLPFMPGIDPADPLGLGRI